MTKPEKKFSRREILKTSAQIGLGATALAGGLLSWRGFSSETLYDFIVVGSGPGGGPLSANLAAAGYRVLLIEAGDDTPNLNYSVPAYHPLATEDPNFSWNFFVQHYSPSSPWSGRDGKYIASQQGILYPRAAAVGGCSAHNAMVSMLADESDWDNLATLTGDASWNSENMSAYFARVQKWLNLEQNPIDLVFQDAALVKIAHAALQEGRVVGELAKRLLWDLEHGQFKNWLSLDPNDPYYLENRLEGVFLTPKATLNGVRNGARERVLAALAAYPNQLTLLKNTLATKIVFRDGTNEALGVQYLQGSHLYQADPAATPQAALRATQGLAKLAPRGEVILSGGAFNSPQLLMLSGIGPADELAQSGIKPQIGLPGVGKNLQDRYEISVVSQLKTPLTLLQACQYGQTNDPCLGQYRKDPSDTVYGSNGIIVGLKSRSTPDQPDPDLFVFGVPGCFIGYYPSWSRNYFRPDLFTWAVLKGHTENTAGEVRLKSADPSARPDINFHFFDDGNDSGGRDLAAVLAGVKLARALGANDLFQAVAQGEVFPGAEIETDDQLKAYIQRSAWGHHASCSNKIGSDTDPTAVLDSDFRVRQTKNVRVVDASVFPKIPGLFIALAIYMISEKASDVILRDRAKAD